MVRSLAARHLVALLVTWALAGCEPTRGGRLDSGLSTRRERLSAGLDHTCEVREDQGLYCWGANTHGELGDGSLRPRPAATRIGQDTDWAEVWCREQSSCASKEDGSLWCWGQKEGLASSAMSAVPFQVGEGAGWVQAAPGRNHTCALRADGSLWCWGDNTYGQVGGSDLGVFSPTRVGTDEDWVSIAAGWTFTCAVRRGGALLCWGAGFERTPSLVGAAEDWLEVSAFGETACGLRGDGALFCFRREGERIDLPLGSNDFEQLSVGLGHGCALKKSGELFCWGENEFGQVGSGELGASTNFVPVGAGRQWAHVSAGGSHTCALDQEGSRFCWGSNDFGQLGTGTLGLSAEPRQVGSDLDWAFVATGSGFTCALKRTGELFCFGANGQGQLGLGAKASSTPTPVRVDAGSDWKTVAASNTRVVALRGPNGGETLWSFGAMPNGGPVQPLPTERFATLQGWLQVSSGFLHDCAVRGDGTLWCWGDNAYGQLGRRDPMNANEPLQVGVDNDWSEVAAGNLHTCGLRRNGTLWCFGHNAEGQVGTGSDKEKNVYVPMRVGFESDWVKVAAGRYFSCALKDGGTPFCWGENRQGQVGDGSGLRAFAPTPVAGGHSFSKLGPGCGLAADGALWCWGPLERDPAAPGDLTSERIPVRMGSLSGLADMTAPGKHQCALRDDGTLWCWGDNRHGQLGSGLAFSPTPLAVP